MKLNISLSCYSCTGNLLIATAIIQQLYNRYALIAAANKEVDRFEARLLPRYRSTVLGWLDISAAIVQQMPKGFQEQKNTQSP